jgi:GTP cyclohydrolase II
MTRSRQYGDTAKPVARYLETQLASAISPELKSETLSSPMKLKQIAEVSLPTRWAKFRMLGFEMLRINKSTGVENRETALALLLGDVHSFPPVVRIHSQCITGEAFHSLRCDCHDQLHMALRAIAEEGAGLLIYEQQEGRGIGLMEKLRAYELQDQGLDTVEANLRLGHAVDSRDYQLAVQILYFLRIHSLRLISNNPEKVKAVLDSGIHLVERISADVPLDIHFTHYLNTKREKLGHLSAASSDESLEDGSLRDGQTSGACDEAANRIADFGVDLRGASW